MRFLLIGILAFIFTIFSLTIQANTSSERLERFAFASCSKPNQPQPLWDVVREKNPQFFMWVGDSIYADTTDMAKMWSDYELQLSNSDYKKVMAQMPILGVWDDHDYGANDAGGEYPMKRESQKLFLDFIGEPENSPRRSQEGIYTSYTYGPDGQKVKLILLDTRYHREDPDKKNADILGAEQWKWFERELAESDAQIHFIVSSYPILFFKNGYGEQWRNFKKPTKKLAKLLRKHKPEGLVFLTGDRHFTGIWSDEVNGRTYHELMSSGFTKRVKKKSHRRLIKQLFGRGNALTQKNFSLIEIDWDAKPLRLTFHGINRDGKSRLKKVLQLKRNYFQVDD